MSTEQLLADGNVTLDLNYLPLSGGTLTGKIQLQSFAFGEQGYAVHGDGIGEVRINGGSSTKVGGSLTLYPQDLPADTDLKGGFVLGSVYGNISSGLSGFPSGSLTWNNREVERVNVEKSDYRLGYVRYESGFQIVYGMTVIPNGSIYTTVTFPVAFYNADAYTLTASYQDHTTSISGGKLRIWVDNFSNGVSCRISAVQSETNTYDWDRWIRWIAIGTWK